MVRVLTRCERDYRAAQGEPGDSSSVGRDYSHADVLSYGGRVEGSQFEGLDIVVLGE